MPAQRFDQVLPSAAVARLSEINATGTWASPYANSADGVIEFKAIGTAVRAPGGVALKTPFTSDVSGQEFAKLIMAGAVPVSLVLGISIGVRHIGTAITQFTRDRRASQRPSTAVLSLDRERRAAARQPRARHDHPQAVGVLEPDGQDNEQDAFDASEEQQ